MTPAFVVGCVCVQDPSDELYAVAPMRTRKMISFDWAAGYVSPYRCTNDDRADAIMERIGEIAPLSPSF